MRWPPRSSARSPTRCAKSGAVALRLVEQRYQKPDELRPLQEKAAWGLLRRSSPVGRALLRLRSRLHRWGPPPADVLPESAAAVTRGCVGAGSRVCCALSGGVDSVVLFELLRRLQPRFGFSLRAAPSTSLGPNAAAWARACAERFRLAADVLQVFRVEVGAPADDLRAAARASPRLA